MSSPKGDTLHGTCTVASSCRSTKVNSNTLGFGQYHPWFYTQYSAMSIIRLRTIRFAVYPLMTNDEGGK